MTPLVSIVVPLYNYSSYIGWCIQSIINQDYENYELIIIDDCSTDGSYEVAQQYESDKIKLFRFDRNHGYSKAKNEGIILSSGKYIVHLDADDMLTKDSISCRVRAAMKEKAGLVHARAITVRGKISLEQCYELKKKQYQNPKIHAQTVLIHRKVYQEYGLYDENLRSRGDKEMWWRLFGKGCKGPHLTKKVFIKKDVAYYRRHGQSMMAERRRNRKYNNKITRKLEAAYQMRQKEGITKKNTRFLEK